MWLGRLDVATLRLVQERRYSAAQVDGQKVCSLFTSENNGCDCKDDSSKLACSSRKGVTIVAACVVSVISMDAQTNMLSLQKMRMKWVNSILVCTNNTTKDMNTDQYHKFYLKFLFCSYQCIFWLHQVTL